MLRKWVWSSSGSDWQLCEDRALGHWLTSLVQLFSLLSCTDRWGPVRLQKSSASVVWSVCCWKSLTCWIRSHVALEVVLCYHLCCVQWVILCVLSCFRCWVSLWICSFFSCVTFLTAVAWATVALAQIVCLYVDHKRDSSVLLGKIWRKVKQFSAREIQEFLLLLDTSLRRWWGSWWWISCPDLVAFWSLE